MPRVMLLIRYRGNLKDQFHSKYVKYHDQIPNIDAFLLEIFHTK